MLYRRLSGPVQLTDTTAEISGMIKWDGVNFQGYDGSSWLDFGVGVTAGDEISGTVQDTLTFTRTGVVGTELVALKYKLGSDDSGRVGFERVDASNHAFRVNMRVAGSAAVQGIYIHPNGGIGIGSGASIAEQCVAIGKTASAYGAAEGSVAFGYDAHSNHGGIAIGKSATADTDYSGIVIGIGTTTTGNSSMHLGIYSTGSGNKGTSFGSFLDTQAFTDTIVIGSGQGSSNKFKAYANDTIVFGLNIDGTTPWYAMDTSAIKTFSGKPIRFYPGNEASANYIAHKAGTLTTTTTYLWPNDGANGQVLTTNASGSLSWTTPSSGSPGGNSGAVQYNNGGAFGGDETNFFWDAVNYRLGIGSGAPSARLAVGANGSVNDIIYATGTVSSTVRIDNTGTGASQAALDASSSGAATVNYGVWSSASGAATNYGGYALSSGSAGTGYGLYGSNTNSSTNNQFGVYGVCSGATGASDAHGVYGSSAAASAIGYGVYGVSTGATSNFGGLFKATSASGINYGVYGICDGTSTSSQYGVYGACTGATVTGTKYGIYGAVSGTATTNYGAYGAATGGSTANYGGYFSTSGSTGGAYGVYGTNTNSSTNNQFGVYGNVTGATGAALSYGTYGASSAACTAGYGAYGVCSGAATNYGVYGTSSGSGNNYGVYGAASGGTVNWAGYFAGNVALGGTAAASELRFYEATGSGTNYTAFKAQAQTGDVTYTLPAADGGSGQVLSTNGSGTLSWATMSSSSPGGNSSAVQFNNGGAFGGDDTQFSYSVGTTNVSIGTTGGSSKLSVGGAGSSAYTIFGGTAVTGSGLYGVCGENASTTGSGVHTGVVGRAIGDASGAIKCGVYGFVQDNGDVSYGVQGYVSGGVAKYGGKFTADSAGNGNNYGAYADCIGSAGAGTHYGLYASATGTAATNYGVYGIASGGTANFAGYFAGNVALGGTAAASELRFYEATGSGTNYTAFKAQPQVGDVTYTLPAADGAAGTVLTTSGAGTLSWTAAGSPAGNTGNVQYKTAGGAFAGEDALYWDAANDRLSIGGTTTPLSKLAVGGAGNTTYMIYGEVGIDNGTAIWGYNTSTGTGFARGVYGTCSGATGTGTKYGVWGACTGTAANNYGVYGAASGGTINYGGYFTTSSDASFGVYAANTGSGAASSHFGVRGDVSGSNGTFKYGVYGGASSAADNNYGVYGTATGATNNYGVYGVTAANGGYGVYGSNTSTGTGSQYGVYGSCTANTVTGTKHGVYGTSSGTSSFAYGVMGVASDATTRNSGVYGEATAANTLNVGTYGYAAAATSNYGVNGYVDGATGTCAAVRGIDAGTSTGSHYGVYGECQGATGTGTKYGVYGYANGTATVNYGVYGVASGGTANWAGYFDGKIGITNGNEIRFYEPTGGGSDYTGFKAGNATASVIYTLPTADGSNGDQLTTNGAGTLSWAVASDARIKTNIRELDMGIGAIMALRPTRYSVHDYAFQDGKLCVKETSSEQIGFVAQEAVEAVPEMVHVPQDESMEVWGIKPQRLIPVLVKAIQDQQKMIDKLTKKVEEINARR